MRVITNKKQPSKHIASKASQEAVGLFFSCLGAIHHQLIAGGHRLTAVDELGWEEIDATVVSDTLKYLECELIEIDENLCRSDLTASQRAKAIKRRKDIWESLHPEGGRIPLTLGGQQVVGFAADTSAVSGESKRRINEHLSRAAELGTDLDAVYGTSLDTGVELDALKKMTPEERAPLIAEAKTGAVVTARKPFARISLQIEYLDTNEGAAADLNRPVAAFFALVCCSSFLPTSSNLRC